MPALGNYSANIPKAEDDGSEADVREEMGKISQKDTVEYTQDFVDTKLADPGFYGFIQGAAEGVDGSGPSIQEYLDGKNPEEIARLAEQYESTVKPFILKFEKFVGTEFLGKLSVLDKAGETSAKESVTSFLGKKAGSDPNGFLAQYPPLLEKYEELTAEATAVQDRLQKNYRLTDTQQLTRKGAEFSLEAQRGVEQQAANTAEHKAKRKEIGPQWWTRIKKFLSWNFKGKPQTRSDDQMAEDEAYESSQKPLGMEIDHLRGLTENIKGDVAKKAEIDEKIKDVRGELVKVLTDSEEIQQMMTAALTAAVGKAKFDVDKAAESLDAMGEVWDEGENTTYDTEMARLLEVVYKKEVEDSVPDAKAKAVDLTKMKAFDNFLKINMNSSQARQMMEKVLDDKIAALSPAEQRSTKGAQLSRMKYKVSIL